MYATRVPEITGSGHDGWRRVGRHQQAEMASTLTWNGGGTVRGQEWVLPHGQGQSQLQNVGAGSKR
jgi:hypothetical protein